MQIGLDNIQQKNYTYEPIPRSTPVITKMSPVELLLVVLSLVFVLKDFLRSWIHFYRIPNPVGHRVFGSLFQLSYPQSKVLLL